MKITLQTQPVFKECPQDQMSLMPQCLSEMIPPNHIVRTINGAIDRIELDSLLARYKGGGTSSYHPKMMLKALVYGYSQRIYSSRRIAKALREDITFMWLCSENKPDFRTINDFRGNRMKAVIDDIFTAVLEYLIEKGYVKLENYFVDGTKLEANANKSKVIWAKRRATSEKRVREDIQKLLTQIEEVNEEEQAEYGNADLEELGENSQEDMNSERLKEKISELNEQLRQKINPEKRVRSVIKKLETDCLPRLEKYEQQEELLAGRNCCSTTDPDATCMLMKEDRGARQPWPKPAYNVHAGTEGQFIVGFSVHGRAGDTSCLIPHLEQLEQGLGRLPDKIIADAAYGSEENYTYLEEHHVENYLKYNYFYYDTHKHREIDKDQKRRYRSERFTYDSDKDEFICPENKRLHYVRTGPYTSDNGYQTERRHYECEDCHNCPYKVYCTTSPGNRQVWRSLKLMAYQQQARENLTSEEGKVLRAKRSVEVETTFGHTKHNMGFRRFLLRGLDKVKVEWGLLCIAINMQKMAAA
jgi:transposase